MSTSPIPPILDQDRYAVYEPTAATTDFALGFPLFGDAGDVAVFLDGEPLDLGIDYTVRSVAKGAALTPAPVTDAYVRLNAPISAGKLEVYGNFRPRRTIQATAPYGTRDFNFAFSLLMAAMREMWSKFTRAIKVPVGEEDLTIPSADERAGQVLAFDTTGKPTVGGRYSDLMASASAATISAANAFASASAAAASAAAAAKFNPAEYSTTVQIATMLESRAPTSRKLRAGKGLKLNGVTGTDAAPVEADLAADLLFGFDLSAFAAVQALWDAGADEGLHPISPAQFKAAIAAHSTPDEYVSDEIAITLSSSVTLTHGLGVAPKIVELYLVCKASDQGYSAGDVVLIPSCAVYVGSGSVSGVQAATVGTTSIAISFCNYTTWMSPKTGGAANFISGIKWKLVVRARK